MNKKEMLHEELSMIYDMFTIFELSEPSVLRIANQEISFINSLHRMIENEWYDRCPGYITSFRTHIKDNLNETMTDGEISRFNRALKEIDVFESMMETA